MLRKILDDGKHENWEDVLGDVCFAYRSTIHSSTLESPYYLLHGRDPNIPINTFLDATPPAVASTDFLENLTERLRYSFHLVKEATAKAREHQKEQYDKRAKELNFKVGDRVLLDIRKVDPKDSRKFTSFYKGPYRIIKTYENKTVDIADASHNPQRVHVNRLKPLFETLIWGDAHIEEQPTERQNPITERELRRNQLNLRPLKDIQKPVRYREV